MSWNLKDVTIERSNECKSLSEARSNDARIL